jgi:acetyl esterase/lipase
MEECFVNKKTSLKVWSGLLVVLSLGAWNTRTVFAQSQTTAQQVILLWPDGAPGAIGTEEVDRPTLEIYLPPVAKAAGTAVVICPGGGYALLEMIHEGRETAEWLNLLGVAAFVLKYRLGPRYHHPAMLQDAQRALRYVRTHAREFGVSPGRIGIMGFSAGGHLASTAATHFDSGNPSAADPIERASSRPDFLILGYPVISFTTQYTNYGSRNMLLGFNPDPKLLENLSNEKQVTGETPPTFLFHMTEDKVVAVENSILFYLALRKAGVPAELHIYEKGKHGVALARNDPVLSSWTTRLADWLKTRGLLKNISDGNQQTQLKAGTRHTP